MISGRRFRNAGRARQIVMYLAAEMTTATLKQIGDKLGDRDHTTVRHGIMRIDQLRRSDPTIAADLNAIRERLKDRLPKVA